MKLTKTYEVASFKTLEDEGPGRFEAVVAVIGNVDLQGDRIMPGAFKSTITAARAKGDPIPVIWSHQWINPDAHIGFVDPADVEEIAIDGRKDDVVGGLQVKGTIDVHKPFAAQVFDLLKSRRVKEWSFAYDVPKGGERRAEDDANELLQLDLLEVGPALKGANPETYTVSAKSALEDELSKAAEEVEKDVMAYVITNATNTGYPISTSTTASTTLPLPNEVKIGRVIGAKAASALKEQLSAAVDAFVSEINGLEDKDVEPEIDEETILLKARIASLGV